MKNHRRPLHPRIAPLLSAALTFVACTDSSDTPTPENQGTDTFPESAWEIEAANARLGRGINMGNALDAPEEEGAWGVVLEEDHFQAVAEAGFDSVRIPVRWSDHVDDAAPHTIDAGFMARVDWAVDTALSNDLAVVLDVHHFEALMAEPDAYIPVLKAIWTQLADRYKDYSPLLYFDLLNEPTGEVTGEQWNDLIADLVTIVRDTNPYRALIVEPVNASDGAGIVDLTLPEDDHLIASFHYYEPFQFTHQNASWVDGSSQWEGMEWPETAADIERVKMSLDDIAQWQETAQVPVYVGEYGTIDFADQTSRESWTAVVVNEFAQHGWSSAYWMFDGTIAGNFGLFNHETGDVNDGILRAVMTPQDVIADNGLDDIGDAELPEGDKVLLDDFEDTLSDRPGACHLAAAIADEMNLDTVGGEWLAFGNLETEITNPEGTHIVTYEENLEDGTEPNIDAPVGDWGSDGNGLAMLMDYQSPEYPFAGIAVHFMGEWNEHFFDFTDLVAISFKAKGNGVLRADFASDAVNNGYPEGDNWGYHGSEFVLSENWTQHVLYADDFTVMPYSPSASDNLTWDDVKEGIFSLVFSVSSTYGLGAHESLAFYVDDIWLHGLQLDDFLQPAD